jgi:hypothetical protein
MAQSEIAARLKTDVVTAMKARDKARLGVLRMLQAALKQVEVDTRTELDDAAVIRVLTSYGRKVKDQIKSYGDGGRDELRVAAETELAIVGEYLPAEMSDEKLAGIVREAVAEVGATGPQDMGKVMKAALARAAGQADGTRVSAMVKQVLAG